MKMKYHGHGIDKVAVYDCNIQAIKVQNYFPNKKNWYNNLNI